ncbi:hypothetical protein LY71_106116 [Geodermatophilus tzadiensis]|uniref:DUF4352 domain-containing protein n=1 Tax=Geodermatophilus tzadiensis TaxID=1137988 RepID=A0A2T0TUK3_9ACTN|nr:hypothetical protein [Geodermatophilus tzadiensis]PRY49339.1 hypothetical protein LY71_106116 [Geodermatophilus tzadiensis]
MNAPRPDARPRPRRVVLLATLAAVVVLAGLALVLGRGGSAEPASAAPDAATSGGPAAAPSPDPQTPVPVVPGPTEGGDQPPPVLSAVGLDEPAAVGDGVRATVRSVEAIDGTGYGPGNIAGPALRVTVRLDNGTAEPVSLDGVAVDLAYGADSTPGSPLDDPSRAPFSGTLAAGSSAEGVYVFTVPADQRDTVTVQVGYRPGAPVLAFTGAP